MTAPNAPLEDLDKLRSRVMFLASVIACGEPYTEHVERAVDEAHACITRLIDAHLDGQGGQS